MNRPKVRTNWSSKPSGKAAPYRYPEGVDIITNLKWFWNAHCGWFETEAWTLFHSGGKVGCDPWGRELPKELVEEMLLPNDKVRQARCEAGSTGTMHKLDKRVEEITTDNGKIIGGHVRWLRLKLYVIRTKN